MIYSFLQNGDGAITIQFENEISEEVNRRVTDLCTAQSLQIVHIMRQ